MESALPSVERSKSNRQIENTKRDQEWPCRYCECTVKRNENQKGMTIQREKSAGLQLGLTDSHFACRPSRIL
jgi:hypothetical protein